MSNYMTDLYSPLVAGILLQAAKDYCKAETPSQRGVVIRQLRPEWMTALSNGASNAVAEKLIHNRDEIAMRLLQVHESATYA